MATTWIRLNVAAFGYAAGTVLQTDDQHAHLAGLTAGNLATIVANPGGTPPVYLPATATSAQDAGLAGILANTGSLSYKVSNPSGTTASRPSGNVVAGFQYFDTTLGKPVFATGTGTWKDSIGTPA